MPTINAFQRRDALVVLLVLFIAALMRFGQPGIVEFFHDDAMLASLAQDMVAGRSFPLTGINSSVGIPNPPTSVYVMALPFALDSDPMTAILFVMALNVVGVGLLWAIAHRYIGRTVALVAGLVYTLNPWAILYSRKIWAQDFHTPFVLLGLLLGLYGFTEAIKRTERDSGGWLTHHEWAQVLCLPVLLFAFQIHFAAWALLPLYMILLWLGRKRFSWRALFLSGILSVLVMLPYAIGFYQTAQANPAQANPGAVSTLASDEGAFSLQSLEYLAYLTTGYGLETWVAPEQQADLLASVPPPALWWIIGGMLLLSLPLLLRESVRWLAPLLLTWAFLPAVALIPQWAGVYPHYFIASIPALALLIAIGVTWVAQIVPLQPYGRSVILVAFAAILLTQGIYWRGLLRYLDATPIDYPGFTIPLHYLHDVEAELETHDDIVVLNDGMSWDLHHESVVWDVMLADSAACVRTLTTTGYAVFPDGAFAALEVPALPIEQAVDGVYVTDEPTVVPQRGDANGYAVHGWDDAPDWGRAPITSLEAPVRFEGDVLLTGYHISDGLMLFEWELPAAQPELDYQYSGQFLDDEGNRLAQYDTNFWQGRHWCAGDRLLTWQAVDVPIAETAAIDVFLYRLGNANEPRYINANILDEMGNPAGQNARITVE